MSTSPAARVAVEGKFFRLNGGKFYVKGCTYGPFAPNARGEMFPEPAQASRDFDQIVQLGANLVRVYYPPPEWLLDQAVLHGLRVFVDIPWPKHLCFLDSARAQAEARRAVRQALTSAQAHPAVFACSVANEIPAEIVRWSGAARVERFIDELIREARGVDPHCLYTFSSYPTTEFLQPQEPDFLCFNVYLHEPRSFDGYLARLQMMADSKPLVLGEFGMDSIRQGEARQREFLDWQIERAFRGGLAGAIVFSYTDDWYRGGMQIEDWGFGLTTRERRPKEAFHVVQRQFGLAPHFPPPRWPKVSVVVASYNGARTLRACLEALLRLRYPDYEIILVDDGSTDATPQIVGDISRAAASEAPSQIPGARTVEENCRPRFIYICHEQNAGLSAARNAGIAAASGEIVAFIDNDCRADEDWLYYLVSDLLRSDFVGMGGHNFLPPEDSSVAAAVLASPGGPAHVMLTDREAEHIPGCNMAFYKWALEEVGGFDPVFRKAGDDVDLCWRLQKRNYSIGFSPSGFVWHYRRSTVKAYLKQQIGYGEAEALLLRKHPENFNSLGGGIWRGRIYNAANPGILLGRPVIYHGVFGGGFFQTLYTPRPAMALMLCTSLGWHLFVNVPLLVLSAYATSFLPVALSSIGLSLGLCVLGALQARVPPGKRRWWSRPLIGLLFFLQPIVRGWARFAWRLNRREKIRARLPAAPAGSAEPPHSFAFWSDGRTERCRFLLALRDRLEQCSCGVETDTGWTDHDLEIAGNRWSRQRLITVTEELEQGKRIVRCRLERRWTLRARLLFFGGAAVELAVILLWARHLPWLWMLPVLLPLAHWMAAEQALEFESRLGAVIDQTALEQGLVKLQGAEAPNPEPTQPASKSGEAQVCSPV